MNYNDELILILLSLHRAIKNCVILGPNARENVFPNFYSSLIGNLIFDPVFIGAKRFFLPLMESPLVIQCYCLGFCS